MPGPEEDLPVCPEQPFPSDRSTAPIRKAARPVAALGSGGDRLSMRIIEGHADWPSLLRMCSSLSTLIRSFTKATLPLSCIQNRSFQVHFTADLHRNTPVERITPGLSVPRSLSWLTGAHPILGG